MDEVTVGGADLDVVELALTVGGLRLGSGPAVLIDPERTPIAALAGDGSLKALQPLAPRPDIVGAVPLSDATVRSAAAAVVFDALPSRAQVAALDALDDGPVAWIALTGRARRTTTASALLGAVRAAATAWSTRTGRAAPVVALPWTLAAQPEHFAVPGPLADADALAGWLASAAGLPEVIVLGESEEHRVLARLEADADGAARALFPSEVLPFHRGERGGGAVVLFTGLSGAGKSTVARAVAAHLEARGTVVSVLDGDEVRQLLSAGLGFDADGRTRNIARIGWVAAQIARAGGVVVAAPIAPFAAGRAEVRRMAEEAGARFVLVHVATALEVCEARDRKGLYAAARAGRIPDFTGISSPYEPPSDADVTVDTAVAEVDDAAAAVLSQLDDMLGP